jgi:hypothetical protein
VVKLKMDSALCSKLLVESWLKADQSDTWIFYFMIAEGKQKQTMAIVGWVGPGTCELAVREKCLCQKSSWRSMDISSQICPSSVRDVKRELGTQNVMPTDGKIRYQGKSHIVV